LSVLIRAGVGLRSPERQRISFRAVNRRGATDYDPGLQRHHILPRQLLGQRCFAPLLTALGRDRLCFEDFRRNGLLLPANDDAAVRIGLPLHRGPHREYNAMVSERFGQIEAHWSALRPRAPEVALRDAYERLELLQRALRRRLLDQQRRLKLNRRDPLGSGVDFSELDAMAALLWPATEVACG
jgi:A nuclease family of the HNH/ENDO VII superfamily with conserved AHH